MIKKLYHRVVDKCWLYHLGECDCNPCIQNTRDDDVAPVTRPLNSGDGQNLILIKYIIFIEQVTIVLGWNMHFSLE